MHLRALGLPPGLYAFAGSVMEAQLRGVSRQFAAMSMMDTWITRNRCISIKNYMLAEPIISTMQGEPPARILNFDNV